MSPPPRRRGLHRRLAAHVALDPTTPTAGGRHLVRDRGRLAPAPGRDPHLPSRGPARQGDAAAHTTGRTGDEHRLRGDRVAVHQRPQSAVRTVPVTPPASGDSSSRTAPATSSSIRPGKPSTTGSAPRGTAGDRVHLGRDHVDPDPRAPWIAARDRTRLTRPSLTATDRVARVERDGPLDHHDQRATLDAARGGDQLTAMKPAGPSATPPALARPRAPARRAAPPT